MSEYISLDCRREKCAYFDWLLWHEMQLRYFDCPESAASLEPPKAACNHILSQHMRNQSLNSLFFPHLKTTRKYPRGVGFRLIFSSFGFFKALFSPIRGKRGGSNPRKGQDRTPESIQGFLRTPDLHLLAP